MNMENKQQLQSVGGIYRRLKRPSSYCLGNVEQDNPIEPIVWNSKWLARDLEKSENKAKR